MLVQHLLNVTIAVKYVTQLGIIVSALEGKHFACTISFESSPKLCEMQMTCAHFPDEGTEVWGS